MNREPANGDLYCMLTDQGYMVSKLLKIEGVLMEDDSPVMIHHMLFYGPEPRMPALEDIPMMQVHVWHAPMHPYSEEELSTMTYLGNVPVTDTDLSGYWHYVQASQGEPEEQPKPDFAAALEAYRAGCAITDPSWAGEAIAAFTKAIDLVPAFYEALDNRGLLYLDLEREDLAKQDFLRSIQVFDSDKNSLPHMKLLWCYTALGEKEAFREKLSECLRRWPDHARWREMRGQS